MVVDDYSHYTWVFFLASKDETFDHVCDLILRLKNERNRNAMRSIRNDNGTEFKNVRFDSFCRDLGLELK